MDKSLRTRLEYLSIRHGLSSRSDKSAPTGGFQPAKALFGSIIVLSRGFCSFESRKLNMKMKRSEMQRSLHLHALATSPFKNAGVFIRLGKDRGMIWTWDKESLRAKGITDLHKVIPETAFHTGSDEIRLVQALDGHEGQVWRGGELIMSQWWPGSVSEQDWTIFSHAAENDDMPPVRLPQPLIPIYAQGSIPSNNVPIESLVSDIPFKQWAMTAACLVLVPALYFTLRIPYLNYQHGTRQAEYQQLWQEKAELRSERTEINTQLNETRKLAALYNQKHPLVPLTEAVDLLVELGSDIQQLGFSEGGYEINFRSTDGFDQTELVRTLEAMESIKSVVLNQENRADRWILEFLLQQDAETAA